MVATLAVLAENGHWIDATAAPEAKTPEEFLAAYYALCDFWTKDIVARPFWETLLSGQASRTLVLGWGVEFYHDVEAANEHMAAVVAHCRGPRSR